MEQTVARITVDEGLTLAQCFYYFAAGVAALIGAWVAVRRYRRNKDAKS